MEQCCNPGGLLRGHGRRWTAFATVRCEASVDGPSVRMAIGVAYPEVLLFGVVEHALARSGGSTLCHCPTRVWRPSLAGHSRDRAHLLGTAQCEALNFSHRVSPRSNTLDG